MTSPLRYPPPAPQPLRPVTRWRLRAVVFSGVAVVVGVFAFVALGPLRSESTGGESTGGLPDGGTVEDSTGAPGTSELRALGCVEARVGDPSKTGQRDAAAPGVPVQIACVVSKESPGLACDDVASTYRHAPGTALLPYTVTVRKGASAAPLCTKGYAASGQERPGEP